MRAKRFQAGKSGGFDNDDIQYYVKIITDDGSELLIKMDEEQRDNLELKLKLIE